MATKASAAAANDVADSLQVVDTNYFDVDSRKSLELVIALVGPVGSGATTVYSLLAEQLKDVYGYDPVYIRLSSLIKDHAHEVSSSIPAELAPTDRIDRYQNIGNDLRKKFGEAYLADRTIERIAIERQTRGGYKVINDSRVVDPQRRVYFVDSLKNPAELRRLRQVYKDLLWVVSVFAPENVRHGRLAANGLTEDHARHAMRRDYEEEEKTGQNVSRIAHQADYFIRNSTDLKDNLKPAIDRFCEAILSTKLHTPTRDEKGMMEAASVAVRSACLSRQVGAAIYSRDGDLLGVGCNDVPKFGGGLYGEGENDNRCFHWKDKICHNDQRKTALATRVAGTFGVSQKSGVASVETVLDSGVGSLIEFSRSVHAEMEAIVSVARSGGGSTLRSTLYTTTFPCHNCARHIVAAGVTTVFYVEPYSKSLALDLHSDAISLEESSTDKVRFLQYQGFSPRISIRLFSSAGIERKGNGRYIERHSTEGVPVFSSPLDSYVMSENLVIQTLQSGENSDDRTNP